jgi:hypothetical protein
MYDQGNEVVGGWKFRVLLLQSKFTVHHPQQLDSQPLHWIVNIQVTKAVLLHHRGHLHGFVPSVHSFHIIYYIISESSRDRKQDLSY